MFRLLRHFSLTSALVITAVTVVLVLFHRQGAVLELIASAESHNASLARSFANTIWPEFADYITTVEDDGDGLRLRPETGRMHEALRTLTDGLPVLKIKVYNVRGLTVYSSQASQMGEDKSENPGFLMARDASMPASKLSFRDSFSAFSGAVEDRDLVETYVAVQDPTGAVVGVLEIYTDVTPLMARLNRNTTAYAAIFLLIFAMLYGVLFVIVRRADRILKSQYFELEDNERKIQAKNTALEKEIGEREQVEAALRAAKEAAESANRSKSEFLATVSHEVRTPMNGVLGMVAVLLETNLAQEQREYAETIKESGESLMTIINDILDFSKAEAGKIRLVEMDFELVPVIDNAVELFGPEADRKGIDLAAYGAPDIPKELLGDAGRIRQILLNLIGNAVKFTKSGGVTLEVSVDGRSSTPDEVFLRFTVTDTGIGIPAEALEKIFGAFTQADSSTTRSFGGTGLGLAISENLVTLMGGKIGVSSEFGRGSQFWFTIQLKQCSNPSGPWVDDLSEMAVGGEVLVIGAADTARRFIEKQLFALGMRVTSAPDADAGLSLLRKAKQAGSPADLVIVDKMMPDADCEVLAGRIRSAGSRNDGVIILSSSSGQIATDSKARALGFDAALHKPLRPGQLLKCLNHAFEARAGKSRSRARKAPTMRASAGDQRRILLAEDNLANQKVVAAFLNGSGYRMDTVANGTDAVEALRYRPYDLVLMDLEMPEMDGRAAASQIRRLSGCAKDVPIIAITAHVMDSDQEACEAAGMNDFITKPIDRATLIDKIEFWLGRSASGKPGHAKPVARAKAPAKRRAGGGRSARSS